MLCQDHRTAGQRRIVLRLPDPNPRHVGNRILSFVRHASSLAEWSGSLNPLKEDLSANFANYSDYF
jgi:hypothetical protein